MQDACVPLLPARMKRVVDAVAGFAGRDAPLLVAQGALEEMCPSLDPKKTLALCRARNVEKLQEKPMLDDVATLAHRHIGDLLTDEEVRDVVDRLVHR